MARVVGDIAVKVGADIGPLQQNMRRAGKSVEGFEQKTKQMAVNVAKAGAAIGVAVAGIGSALLKAGSEAAAVGLEIRNLSNIAGTSATDFQKMAAAARTVGIEQQKLSDIFKDVNDKFGDYMATGAGPLADFFENIAPKVGVTADEFAKLSGPDALQLYVKSLEDASVSQQEMTFYMEALASDATALIPLLRNNGAEMRALGDEALRTGQVLSDEMIDNAVELDRELAKLSNTLKTQATAAVLEHKDELILLVNFITGTLIPAVSALADTLGTVALGWKTIAQEARAAIEPLTDALGLTERLSEAATQTPENMAAAQADVARTNQMGGGDVSNTGTFIVDDQGNIVPAGMPDSPSQGLGTRVYSGRGTAAGPTPEEALEAFIEARRAEVEAAREHEEELTEVARSGSAARVAIEQQAADDERDIEEQLRQDKMRMLSGAFGDLSSLMQTENKKLFAIGKAAAIAEATVSGYHSAVRAWEGGLRFSGGNPAVAAAFAAASIAKTGALINKLQSTSIGGGGGTSDSGGGGAAVAGAQAQQPITTFSFTLQNDLMGFGESFARQMIERLNATQRNGGTIRGVINNA